MELEVDQNGKDIQGKGSRKFVKLFSVIHLNQLGIQVLDGAIESFPYVSLRPLYFAFQQRVQRE